MGRGKGRRVQTGVSETLQNRIIQEEERKARLRALQEKDVLCIVQGTDVIKYSGLQKLPSFTVAQLIQALQIQAVDASCDLNPAMDLKEVLLKMSGHIEENECVFRIYMRNSINYKHFAMLQRCVERIYLSTSLCDIQGWILQYGTVFVFGSADFDLKQSISRVREAVEHIMMCKKTAKDELV